MQTPNFRRGAAKPTGGGGKFYASALPLEQKRTLCMSLLGEFGVQHITERYEELIHSCPLPFGSHKNGDKSPSASLNYEKLTFNCLGCGSSGGLLWFIAVCRGEGTDHSRSWLENHLGLTEDEDSIEKLMDWIDAMYAPSSRVRPQIPKFDRKVLRKYQFIHPYLTEGRHIPVDTLIKFNVGYGEFKLRIGDDFVQSERIIIPHFWNGDLVGWQTRRLNKRDGTPKYSSSQDLPKDVTLYNYAGPGRSALVVESPMSVLSKVHCCEGMEATFGAKVTERQLRLMDQHSESTLWFDNDDAGWDATQKVAVALLKHHPVYIVPNPYDADPADLDDATFTELLSQRVLASLWKPPDEDDLIEYHREEVAA